MKMTKHLQDRLMGRSTPTSNKRPYVANKIKKLEHVREAPHKGLSHPPEDLEEIKLIADELLKWSENPNNNVYNDFALDRRWNPYHFKHLADKSEYFANIQTIVKERIASRIQHQSRSGRADQKIDMAWVKEFLPMYSDEYKRQRSEIVTARIEGNRNSQTTINVITEPIPDPKDNKDV